MDAAAEKKLFSAVIIKKTKPADAVKLLRQCAAYEIIVKKLDHALFDEVVADEHLSLRHYLRTRIDAVKLPITDMYAAALFSCNVKSCILCN